jgi:hypothetical protein
MLRNSLVTGWPLHEQFALLGVALPPWPEEPQPSTDDGDVLERGLAYAQVLREWRRQLGCAEENLRNAMAGFCENRLTQLPLRGWEGWVTVVILSDLHRETAGNLMLISGAGMSPADFSRAQLIGAAVCLILDYQISAATLVLSWVRQQEPPALLWRHGLVDAVLRIVGDAGSLSIRSDGSPRQWLDVVRQRSHLMQLLRTLVGDLEGAGVPKTQELIAMACVLRAEEQESGMKVAAGAWMVWIAEAHRRLQAGDTEAGYRLLENLLDPAVQPPPPGADPNAWHHLTINAATLAAQATPRLTLIESKSLPRSGHHHLRHLLLNAHGDDFSYCERYQEPGCCQVMPCNAEPWWRHARVLGHDHIRLIKSHDYSLDDVPYPTPLGLVRLVQVRRPLPLLASWLELKQLNVNREMLKDHGIDPIRIYLNHEPALIESSWQLIDECGSTMNTEEALQWLQGKTAYISGFLNKWLPLSSPLPLEEAPARGTYVLRYEDLGAQAGLLRAIGGTPDRLRPGRADTAFSPRDGSCLRRRSRRISALLESVEASMRECDAQILAGAASWQHLLNYGEVGGGD